MNLFFVPDISEEIISLGTEESGHCIRVLRMKSGQQIQITNGIGDLATAEILDDSPSHCTARVLELVHSPARPYHLHIALAPTKNIDRFEFFLEKATESGIDEITPLICQNSERKKLNPDRLQKILVSSLKQSHGTILPVFHKLMPIEKFLSVPIEGKKYIAHCHNTSKYTIKNEYSGESPVTVLIGPEGDFSKEEISAAETQGFIPISLGKNRLRTETAAIAACMMLNFINEC